jgi:hypothetical protein
MSWGGGGAHAVKVTAAAVAAPRRKPFIIASLSCFSARKDAPAMARRRESKDSAGLGRWSLVTGIVGRDNRMKKEVRGCTRNPVSRFECEAIGRESRIGSGWSSR